MEADSNIYECDECGWEGSHEEKVLQIAKDGLNTLCCPVCGNDWFDVWKPAQRNLPDWTGIE